MKIQTERIKKKESKINEYEIKTELIKDITKRETKGLKIERVNKLYKIEKIKAVIKILRTKMEFDNETENGSNA